MKKGIHLIHSVILVMTLTASALFAAPDLETRIQNLISQMTLEEKVGQMTQLTLETVKKDGDHPQFTIDSAKLRKLLVDHHVGSILNCGGQANSIDTWHTIITSIQDIALKETRLKIPVIYGIDSIHGANYIRPATLFPQGLAMAAAADPQLVQQGAAITAAETRAVGIPWNFNPVLGVGRQPMWSRIWETFGEDPYICATLGAAYIRGLQGDDISAPNHVVGCMKHYLGYSIPRAGRDRTPAWIPDRQLREIFLPPFRAAVQAGVETVMVNSAEINGSPVHASSYYLNDILRGELGFKGLVVTDWNDINNLFTREMVAPDQRTAVKMAVMAGVDMSMVPFDMSFSNHLIDLVKKGEVPTARIDNAVANILRVKFKLGLFDNPYPPKDLARNIGSPQRWAVSLQAARKAMVLLKNDRNILPLPPQTRLLVTGPAANLKKVLNGGWSYTWQGENESLYPKDKPTILQALRDSLSPQQVIYVPGAAFDKPIDIARAAQAAAQCDVIIACLGEDTYCETPGNIYDLTISQPQQDLMRALAATGKPVIMVLTEGRPRVISNIESMARAILFAGLPGPQGGRAIADVLLGQYNPGGRLPFTYPRYPGGFEWYDAKKSAIDAGARAQAQWPFGHGLSYTQFKYSNLKLSDPHLKLDDLESIRVSVDLTNIGSRPGDEIVQLYLSDVVASITPPNKRLKGFQRISLKPNQRQTITFTLPREAFTFIDHKSRSAIEPGQFIIRVGTLQTDFFLTR